MSVENLLHSLIQKHAKLENDIHSENNHPSPNQDLINQLKREKLGLKDQIQRLEHTISPSND